MIRRQLLVSVSHFAHPRRAPETLEALALAERRRGEDDAVTASVEMIPQNVRHLHGADRNRPVADVENASGDIPRSGYLLPDCLEGVCILLEVPQGGLQAVNGPGPDCEFPARLRILDEGQVSGDLLEALPQCAKVGFQMAVPKRRVFRRKDHRFARSGSAADSGEHGGKFTHPLAKFFDCGQCGGDPLCRKISRHRRQTPEDRFKIGDGVGKRPRGDFDPEGATYRLLEVVCLVDHAV